MSMLKHKVSLFDQHGGHMGDAQPWSLATDGFWSEADVKMDKKHIKSIRVEFSDGSYMDMTQDLSVSGL